MSIVPVNWATIPDASSSTLPTATTKSTSGDNLTDKSTFLKLLVSQIKNQNPLNPTDGVQFLTQLTQFSQLEQAITTNADLQSIQTTLSGGATATTSGGTAGSSSTS